MHRGKSCIAENHALRKSCIEENNTLWKIMHCGKSCIAENHESWKIMHHGNHALRKIMHRKLGIYASRENFIPRQIYINREKTYTSLEFMHHEKISCLVKIYTSREDFIHSWKFRHRTTSWLTIDSQGKLKEKNKRGWWGSTRKSLVKWREF